MNNSNKQRLLLDEGFQVLTGVIVVALIIVAIFGGMILRGHLNSERDDTTEKELVAECLGHDTIALQESCVMAYLRMKGEDPTSQKIDSLQDEIDELQSG